MFKRSIFALALCLSVTLLSGCATNESAVQLRMLEHQASMGNRDAQVYLGTSYMIGRDVVRDLGLAKYWLEKAANQNDAVSQANLASLCLLDQEYEKAFKWYEKSAQNGFTPAMIQLGRCYKNGQGTKQNFETAVDWIKRAAEKDPSAYTQQEVAKELADFYWNGWGGYSKDPEKALDLLKVNLVNRNPNELITFSCGYLKASGLRIDFPLQVLSEANMGNRYLAIMQRYISKDVSLDDENFREFLKYINSRKETLGYFVASAIYMSHEQPKEARLYAEKVLEDGDESQIGAGFLLPVDLAREMSRLLLAGGYLEEGWLDTQGKKNPQKGVRLLKQSAVNGNPYAEFGLYQLYKSGNVVKKDLKTAKKWLQKAASHRLIAAEEELARMN